MVLSLLSAAGFSQKPIRVFLDGIEQIFSPAPLILHGSTLVPMRAFFEALGATVQWDDATQAVTGQRGDIRVKLWINKRTALINEAETPLAVPAQLIWNRTFIPLRFVGEALGAGVVWEDHTIYITRPPTPNPDPAPEKPPEQPITTLIIRTVSGVPVPGVSVSIDDKILGISDQNGEIKLVGNWPSYLFVQTSTKSQSGKTGVNIRDGVGIVLVHDSFLMGPSPGGHQPNEQFDRTLVLVPPSINPHNRNTRIAIEYDQNIPPAEKAYMQEFFYVIDPAIRAFIGAPIQDGSFVVSYNGAQHGSWRNNKQVLMLPRLPSLTGENDPVWDEWTLINYIHKFLEGRSIPIPGARSFENLAHPIKNLVSIYLTQRGVRSLTGPVIKPVGYYVQAYQAYESLGSNVLLNTGAHDKPRGAFDPLDFSWESESYRNMNPFTLQYAKSLYFKMAEARARQTGELDFFYVYLNSMVTENPKTPDQFFAMMDKIVWSVDGMKCSDWMKRAAGFQGRTDSPLSLRLLPVRGNFMNIMGMDNPNIIYPFVIARSPARIVDAAVTISIIDSSGTLQARETITSGFPDTSGHPKGIPVGNLAPGSYRVVGETTVDGIKLHAEQVFLVVNAFPEYILRLPEPAPPRRHTKVTISYDSSVPQHAREYLNNLTAQIDPIIRAFVGEPVQNTHILIQHNPHGIWGMNRDMTVLNFPRLPQEGVDVDKGIDSFYFIEYYHGFHKGRDIPIKDARYNQNISQAMRVVLGHYLMQHGLRETQGRSIVSYLRSRQAIETLGPGILVNLGVPANISPNFVPTRSNWELGAPFASQMNTFTLEYGLTPWLVLADAAYQKTGQYDFFRRLQEALFAAPHLDESQFYALIDQLVDSYIEGKTASDWLRSTPLFQGLPAGEIFVRPLPAQGTWFDIGGLNNPRMIFPLVVDRTSLARLLGIPVQVSIISPTGEIVASETVTVGFIPPNNPARGMPVPQGLPPGLYTASVRAIVDGREVKGTQTFWITR